jgi:membrane protein YqaA with SNARE-associated domain
MPSRAGAPPARLVPLTTMLLLALLVVFAINLAPAFMPPTWSILAFFAITFGLPVLPLAIGGAVAASAGRYALALASRRGGRRFLTAGQHDNLAALGDWVDTKGRLAAPVAMLIYSFGPIPSNQLFIAAGLTTANLLPIVGAFFAGRFLSYTLWVSTAHFAITRLGDLFAAELRNGALVGLQLLAIGALVVFTRIDWRRLLASTAPTTPSR